MHFDENPKSQTPNHKKISDVQSTGIKIGFFSLFLTFGFWRL
jgi:hypothetical protein